MAGDRFMAARKRNALLLLLAPISIILGIFFLIPLGIVVVYSFLEPGLYGGVEWTWSPYNDGPILGWPVNDYEKFDPIYLKIFATSLKYALMTVVFSLLICYPAAFWVSRRSERDRKSTRLNSSPS